jgi:hypothetical protein
MEIMCEECGTIINRDASVDNIVIEEYKNIYGTVCPKCGCNIESFEKPFVNYEKEEKMEILKNEMREKIKEKIIRRKQ